ncbi:MAG: aminoacyl-tRNA hydrolase [Gammaproteobacteria bacterium]|nr:aminoacyl-tRNA hydrolase [Gammaproteobacteria bacterium]MCW8988774.1 aminoacyl-tRNA hydrolase [Gammaproteobacteria bacterium]
MSRVSLIVGLGNPGSEYEHTRHNAGFWFLDELARRENVSFKLEKKFYGEVARYTHAGKDVWLLKPTTFMNLSGQAVQALANFYKINLDEILVVHDELDLSVDTARLKKGGGHGGHNGLRDIASKMGGNNFLRLRIGIGHPGDKSKVTNHVLKKASTDDQISIERNIERALNVLPLVIAGEVQKAMNELHTDK